MNLNKYRFKLVFLIIFISVFSLSIISFNYEGEKYNHVLNYLNQYDIIAEVKYSPRQNLQDIDNTIQTIPHSKEYVTSYPVIVYSSENVNLSGEVNANNITMLTTGITSDFLNSEEYERMFKLVMDSSHSGTFGEGEVIVSRRFLDNFNLTLGSIINISFTFEGIINNSIIVEYNAYFNYMKVIGFFEPIHYLEFNWVLFHYNTLENSLFPAEFQESDYYDILDGSNHLYGEGSITQGQCFRTWIFPISSFYYSSETIQNVGEILDMISSRFMLLSLTTRQILDVSSFESAIQPNFSFLGVFIGTIVLIFLYTSRITISFIYSKNKDEFFLSNVQGFSSKKVIFENIKEVIIAGPLGSISGILLMTLFTSIIFTINNTISLDYIFSLESYENILLITIFINLLVVIFSIYYILKYQRIFYCYDSLHTELTDHYNERSWTKNDTFIWILGFSGIISIFLSNLLFSKILDSLLLSLILKFSTILSYLLPIFPILFFYSNVKLLFLFGSFISGKIKKTLSRSGVNRVDCCNIFEGNPTIRMIRSRNRGYYKKHFFQIFLFSCILLSCSIIFSSLGKSESLRIERISQVESGADMCISVSGDLDNFSFNPLENLSTCKYMRSFGEYEDLFTDIIGIENSIDKVLYIGQDNFLKLEATHAINYSLERDEAYVNYNLACSENLDIGSELHLKMYNKQSGSPSERFVVQNITVKIVGIYYKIPGRMGESLIYLDYDFLNEIHTSFSCDWFQGLFVNLTLPNGEFYQNLEQDVLEYRVNNYTPQIDILDVLIDINREFQFNSNNLFIVSSNVSLILLYIIVTIFLYYDLFNERNSEMQLYLVKGFNEKEIRGIIFSERNILILTFFIGMIMGLICSEILFSVINSNAFNNLYGFFEIKYTLEVPIIEIISFFAIVLSSNWILGIIQHRRIMKNISHMWKRTVV